MFLWRHPVKRNVLLLASFVSRQASSPQRIAQHSAHDLWLDACLLFCQLSEENLLTSFASTAFPFANLIEYGERAQKTTYTGTACVVRASIDLWPGFHDWVNIPQVRPCWGVPSPNPALAFVLAGEQFYYEKTRSNFTLEVFINFKRIWCSPSHPCGQSTDE